MSQQAAQVIKSDHVKMAGTCQIELADITPAGGAGTRCATTGHSKPRGEPKATIVSQGDGTVMIQVICSCGEEIQLQCAYDPTAAM